MRSRPVSPGRTTLLGKQEMIVTSTSLLMCDRASLIAQAKGCPLTLEKLQVEVTLHIVVNGQVRPPMPKARFMLGLLVLNWGMKHSQIPMLALDVTPADQVSESFHEAIYGLDHPRCEGATLEYKKFEAVSSKSGLSGCSN